MKKSLLIVFLLAIAGCTNLKFQASASYMTDNLAAELRESRAAAAAPAQTGALEAVKP